MRENMNSINHERRQVDTERLKGLKIQERG
jgi:hypothetical protein